jgi:hypothetical protein
MNARVWSLLWTVLGAACVLPEYSVVPDSQKESPLTVDGGVSVDEAPGVLADAEPECQSCAQDSCEAELEACGGDCAELKWPVSPAWRVSDKADAYVRCLAKSCESPCNVLWGCARNYTFPPASDASVTIRVTDAAMNGELEGMRVKACTDLDPSCQRDIGQTSAAVTNASGRAVLALPPSFEGFFLVEQAEAPAEGEGYLPMTVTWSQPLYRVESLLTVSVFKAGLVTALASTAEKVSPGKGHLVFKAQNCLPERYVDDPEHSASADGVTVNYAPMNGSKVYYTRNGLKISPDATNTTYDGLGFGGAFNLSPGSISVTGVHADAEVSNAVYTARADTLAVVFMLPRTGR